MKKLFIIIMILNLFGCKSQDKKGEQKVLLGMVLLNDNSFNKQILIKEIKANSFLNIKNSTDSADAVVLETADSRIMVAYMDIPIPGDELDYLAKITYTWTNANEQIKHHRSHLIISLIPLHNNMIKAYQDFTILNSLILKATNSMGIYIGQQRLLLSKDYYLEQTLQMTDDNFPIDLWIYIGLTKEKEKVSGYTYGLTSFGKKNLEINNSSNDLEAVHGFLYDIAHYVLIGNIVLKSGETVGRTMDEKIQIKLEDSEFIVEEKTLKLRY